MPIQLPAVKVGEAPADIQEGRERAGECEHGGACEAQASLQDGRDCYGWEFTGNERRGGSSGGDGGGAGAGSGAESDGEDHARRLPAAIAPKWVMMAPVEGVRKVLERAGWGMEEVDLFELNEAFAVQALAVTRELGIGLERVNVNGGAVAIGHPIGASGARVLVTLIHEMIRGDAKKGVAALCLGGGNSVALAVELV